MMVMTTRGGGRTVSDPKTVTAPEAVDLDAVAREFFDREYDRLRPHEVEVPAAWSRHATPGRTYYGRAFERSYRFALDLSLDLAMADRAGRDVWLVYGEVGGLHRRAWVELPGVVFDSASQRFYDREGYYATAPSAPGTCTRRSPHW